MNRKRIITIAVLIAVLSAGFVSAQEDSLVDRAVKKYLRGDYSGAIDDFERSLEMEDNQKARKLLYKSIVEEGKRRHNNGEYKSALLYLERAGGMNPDDFEVAGLLKDIRNKLNIADKSEKESSVAVDMLQEKVDKERQEKDTYRKKVNSLASDRDKVSKELRQAQAELESANIRIEELKETSKKRQKLTMMIMGTTGLLIVFMGTSGSCRT